MTTNEIEIDPVLHALGPMGVFPLMQCFLFYLCYLSDAYQLFGLVFTGQEVGHKCAAPSNQSEALIPELHDDWSNSTVTVRYEKCVISVTNNVSGKEYSCLYGMEYDAPKDRSMVSEFDLVCDRHTLAGLTQTVLSLGVGLGSLLFPWLADEYGRKRIVVICLTLVMAASLLATFAPNYVVFVIAQFFVGFIQSGVGVTAVTAGVELFPSSKRWLISGFWSTLWWAVCTASLAPVAYFLRFHSWRILRLTMCAVAFLVLILLFFAKEPLQWLVAKEKIREAEKLLKEAAKWNRKDFTSVLELFRDILLQDKPGNDASIELNENIARTKSQDQGMDEKTGAESRKRRSTTASMQREEQKHGDVMEESIGFLFIFRHKRLRTNILVCCFIWFVDAVIYSALYLMSGSLALGIYMNFFLNAMLEGASCVVMAISLNRMGRKQTIALFHIIAGLGLIASGVCFHFKDDYRLKTASMVFSLCGILGIGGSFNVMFLFTPEIFPTIIRTRSLGLTAAFSTLGGMIAPFCEMLADYALWAPGVLFGTSSLLVILSLLPLPESKGRELPHNIRDLEAWYHVTSSDKNTDRRTSRASFARVV